MLLLAHVLFLLTLQPAPALRSICIVFRLLAKRPRKAVTLDLLPYWYYSKVSAIRMLPKVLCHAHSYVHRPPEGIFLPNILDSQSIACPPKTPILVTCLAPACFRSRPPSARLLPMPPSRHSGFPERFLGVRRRNRQLFFLFAASGLSA